MDDVLEMVESLLERVPQEGERTPEQQAYALLAAALGFHRREKKPFWWAYFDRLTNPEDEWVETRGTLVADRVEVIEDWGKIGKEKKPGRTIRMLGTLEPGSTITPGASVRAMYEPPLDGMKPPARATRAAANVQKVRSVDVVDGLDAVTIREKPATPGGGQDQLPMGMFEYTFINDGSLIAAICEVAEHVLARDDLPAQPALDLLARRPPRLVTGNFRWRRRSGHLRRGHHPDPARPRSFLRGSPGPTRHREDLRRLTRREEAGGRRVANRSRRAVARCRRELPAQGARCGSRPFQGGQGVEGRRHHHPSVDEARDCQKRSRTSSA